MSSISKYQYFGSYCPGLQKSKATDELSGRTTDQRMDELLDIVKESIEVEGKVFGYILEILKDEDTILASKLYDDMMNRYRKHLN